MQFLDWIVLCGTLLFIVVYGIIKSKKNKNIEDFVLNNTKTNWFTVGISVMATQASAITFLSTPGQAFHDGMGFVQFYFGLPLAMIVICITFIPTYYKLKVYTAYQYLEDRFDAKTRALAAMLFLVHRGLGAGLTIYASAIILSSILGWNLNFLAILIGFLVLTYTMTGGAKALNVTQPQQMMVVLTGMFLTFIAILIYLPDQLSFSNALGIAGANGKMNIVDTSFSPEKRYTIWSGIAGGFFLSLAYFGTDQSQVGRYLSGKSIEESQKGLIMNGLLKVPMQFFILLTGVMVFIFYQFYPSPIHFNPTNEQIVLKSNYSEEYIKLEDQLKDVQKQKKEISLLYIGQLNQDYDNEVLQKYIVSLNSKETHLREQAKELIKKADSTIETNDKDYVFLNFVITYMPKGLVGLLLAVVLSAAMSSSAASLSALATTTTFDIFKRNYPKELNEKQTVNATKLFTLFWGIIAIIFACISSMFENLIQLVNIIGSIFYGTLLGIFLIAFYIKSVKSKAVFYGAIISQLIIFYIYYIDVIGFLWLNFVGALLTIVWSLIISVFTQKQ
nr:sodium:solute symporter [uncultured Flavobacterium sp.]